MKDNSEKSLISSYVIKLLNRDASAKIDRLLKEDYNIVKKNPLILDLILKSQLLSFFSDSGVGGISRDLMIYYRDLELYSALLDVKNMLVISSKENITNRNTPFDERMTRIVKMLIEKGKEDIVKKHIKSTLASCILMGRLGEDFDNLMNDTIGTEELDEDISFFLKNTCAECQEELKLRLENSKTLKDRKEKNEGT